MHLPRRTLFLGFAVLSSLSLAAACGSEDSTSDDGSGGEAGDGATGGSGGSGGEGDTGGTAGSSGSAGSGTGGSAGTSTEGGAGGGGGEGGSGPTDCTDAETLPQTVDVDTSVGPGCVRIERTTITEGAVLTIEPGTTVVMAAAGFLSAGYNGGNSAVVSVGTAANPITFTSEAENPLPGDWECVSIFGASSASEVRYTTFEYGGAPCSTTGADYEGMLQIDATARAVSNSTFRSSSTHGVLILDDGAVREFENNSFSDNEAASINIAAPQLIALGTGLTFADADDYIAVDSTFSLGETGTLLGQPVPFRIPSGFSLGDGAEVTVGAGVRLELMGGSVDVFNSNLIVAGTEADPVVFTSSQANPIPGDWGCITFSSVTGTPRFDHAVIEYAGNGQGCTGANYETALYVPQATVITNSTFRNIAGAAITASDCNIPDWCENTFENVEVGPLACAVGQMPTACP